MFPGLERLELNEEIQVAGLGVEGPLACCRAKQFEPLNAATLAKLPDTIAILFDERDHEPILLTCRYPTSREFIEQSIAGDVLKRVHSVNVPYIPSIPFFLRGSVDWQAPQNIASGESA